MTTEEKAAAFDLLAEAMLNRWWNGRWSWFCKTPCGGPIRDSREEALTDLVRWSERIVKKTRVVPMPVTDAGQ